MYRLVNDLIKQSIRGLCIRIFMLYLYLASVSPTTGDVPVKFFWSFNTGCLLWSPIWCLYLLKCWLNLYLTHRNNSSSLLNMAHYFSRATWSKKVTVTPFRWRSKASLATTTNRLARKKASRHQRTHTPTLTHTHIYTLGGPTSCRCVSVTNISHQECDSESLLSSRLKHFYQTPDIKMCFNEPLDTRPVSEEFKMTQQSESLLVVTL